MSAPAEREQARPRLGRMALALLLGLGLGLGLSRLLWPETGTETGMPLAADPEWAKLGVLAPLAMTAIFFAFTREGGALWFPGAPFLLSMGLMVVCAAVYVARPRGLAAPAE